MSGKRTVQDAVDELLVALRVSFTEDGVVQWLDGSRAAFEQWIERFEAYS